MSKIAFGSKPEFDLGYKDAVHMPCVAVTCQGQEEIVPGADIRFTSSTTVTNCNERAKRHGIADPFMEREVYEGEVFWVLLVPEVVGPLNHQYDLKIDGYVEREMTECESMGCT